MALLGRCGTPAPMALAMEMPDFLSLHAACIRLETTIPRAVAMVGPPEG